MDGTFKSGAKLLYKNIGVACNYRDKEEKMIKFLRLFFYSMASIE